MGESEWEVARVLAGRPALHGPPATAAATAAPDIATAELGPHSNPLEVGLYRAVSVSKGCYIGQVGGQGLGFWGVG